ncbi:Luc7-like protein 3 [Thelotrema lepadinum]|nr:Luc7-like protein 3 [Thelotrema lepadinum]
MLRFKGDSSRPKSDFSKRKKDRGRERSYDREEDRRPERSHRTIDDEDQDRDYRSKRRRSDSYDRYERNDRDRRRRDSYRSHSYSRSRSRSRSPRRSRKYSNGYDDSRERGYKRDRSYERHREDDRERDIDRARDKDKEARGRDANPSSRRRSPSPSRSHTPSKKDEEKSLEDDPDILAKFGPAVLKKKSKPKPVPEDAAPTSNPSSTSKPKKEKKEKKHKIAPTSQPMIVVTVNDRLGTKCAIPCLASDSIKLFKQQVAARIGRDAHSIMIKRQGERPMKEILTLEDYGQQVPVTPLQSNILTPLKGITAGGVQLDLELDTGE